MRRMGNFFGKNDLYVRPLMQDDELLYSFVSDEDDEDDTAAIDKMELTRDLMNSGELNLAEICIDSQSFINISSSDHDVLREIRKWDPCGENMTCHSVKTMSNGIVVDNMDGDETRIQKQKHKQSRVPYVNVVAKKIKNVNHNYFGASGSFGIHREMISDSVGMDAYRGALLNNHSLMNRATVMDVGCGTGILRNGSAITADPKGRVANPFDYGSGFLDPLRFLDPGFIYDARPTEYKAFLCSIGYSDESMHRITRHSSRCTRPVATASDFNYPSITVPNLKDSYSATRTVTNVGKPRSVYRAQVIPPSGINITVVPKVLVFRNYCQKMEFKVNFRAMSPSKDYVFGSLSWLSKENQVTSPLVVQVLS